MGTLVYVRPVNGLQVNYGWNRPDRFDAGDGGILGHAEANPLPPLFVLRANAPKPARATKKKAGGITSTSFVDAGAVPAARQAGWSIGKARLGSATNSTRVKSVYILIDGVKYAWNMPLTTYNAVAGDRAALGIRDATANDKDLVFGASTPKPPRAFSQVGESIVSTFANPDGDLPDGWSLSGSTVNPETQIA